MTTVLIIPPLSSASLLNIGQGRICYCSSTRPSSASLKRFRIRAIKEKAEEIKDPSSSSSSTPEEITTKYGLEAGLWKICSFFILNPSTVFRIDKEEIVFNFHLGFVPKISQYGKKQQVDQLSYNLEIFSSKDEDKEGVKKNKSKGDQAKELLAKYGGAYLATSITLSLISFSLCYVLINSGVDVQALLQKVGISTNEAGEKVGTFALAYAAHKAASPIRFPPTVALTPIVASWIGKKVQQDK